MAIKMKRIMIVFWLMAGTLIAAKAQNNTINAALSGGDSHTLAMYFDNNVNVTILDNENTYSKAQAEMVIKDFFAKHQPKSFAPVHEGTSPEGSKFSVGTLTTASGNFRTFVLIKQKGTTFLIQEIRFEEP
jgi:Domain of unknown function (DUF4783)